ncbi:MAG: Na+/H+ antiporter subunit E [Bacillota bacterium]|nr:Na+/H+ antiporter subunit E [Bacillota bacterium]
MKDTLKLWIVLNIFWLLLTVSFYWVDILIGIVFSSFTAYFSIKLLESRNVTFPPLIVFGKYVVVLFFEIFVSSFHHIKRILSKDEENVVIFNLNVKSEKMGELIMMANFITLTPGTVTVDICDDRIKVVAIESRNKDRGIIRKKLENTFFKIFN